MYHYEITLEKCLTNLTQEGKYEINCVSIAGRLPQTYAETQPMYNEEIKKYGYLKNYEMDIMFNLPHYENDINIGEDTISIHYTTPEHQLDHIIFLRKKHTKN